MSGAPGFLARWSRRKRAEARGAPLPEPPPEAPPPAPAEGAAPAEAPAAPEAPAFDPASLPDLETLDAGSDFAAFLRPGVPEALRNAALRKAWLLDPLIRDHVSPLDYAWDFNAPGGLPPGFAPELGEAAEVVRDLVARAVGLAPPAAAEGEAAAPEGADRAAPLGPAPAPAALAGTAGPDGPPAEAPPPEALRLAAVPPEAPAPAERPAPAPPPRRRHGGALPA